MTTEPNHEKIISLSDLNYYPGSDFLDRVIQLLWTEKPTRRIWLMTPESSPIIYLEDTQMTPQKEWDQDPRWIDYGIVDLPFMSEFYPIWDGMVPIRLQGLPISECSEAHLVITTELNLQLAGNTLEEAQRLLWGLSQSEVGSTTLQPARAVAGQPINFSVTYTAGPGGLPKGAYVRLVVPKSFTLPQIKDSVAPGFAMISHAECDMNIVEIRNMLETHEKSSIICRLDGPLAPGGNFSIQYATQQSYIFPTVLHEVEMRTWFSNLPPLTISVAPSEETPFVNMLPANGHSFTFEPGQTERLHLVLPGRRYVSETLNLKGTFTDHFRNVPPSGPIDTDFECWLVSENGETLLGTPAGHFVARHRFTIPLPELAPGIYRVFARRVGTGAEVARSNPMEIIPDGSGERLYWGEIHSHTELGDGSGDFKETYRFVKDEGSLEFATVSEHAEYFSDNQWELMQDVINSCNEPGRFTTLIGYEFIGLQKDRNVYTSRDRLDLMRGSYHGTNTLDKVWSHFHGDEEVVGGAHATIVHKTKWEHHDPSVERFIEIYSMWGACDFREGPLKAPWIEKGRGLSANEILKKGAKLGFTAGGDCHEGHGGFPSEDPDGQGTTPHSFAAILLFRCGLTAANMSQLDRPDLIGALRNRRTYATTGIRILLDYSVSGITMGSVGQAEVAECSATIHAVSPLQRVEIIKDGQIVWLQDVEGLDVTINWIDPEPPTNEHYYYLHLVQQDGHHAWASPVWISPLP